MYGRSLPVEVPFEWCHECTVFKVSENPVEVFIDNPDKPEFTMTVQYSCKHARFCKAVEDARAKHIGEAILGDIREYRRVHNLSCQGETDGD